MLGQNRYIPYYFGGFLNYFLNKWKKNWKSFAKKQNYENS